MSPPRPRGVQGAICTRACLLMWPWLEPMGPYAPYRCVFAVRMPPVRVGAAPKAPKGPKICNLGGPCGVSGSQQRRHVPICGVQYGLEHHSGWCAAWCAGWVHHACAVALYMSHAPPRCKHAPPHAPTVPRRHVCACASSCGLGASSWAHPPHTTAFLRFGCCPCMQAPPQKPLKRPKICNLGGPCGVARSQKNRYALMPSALSGVHRDLSLIHI